MAVVVHEEALALHWHEMASSLCRVNGLFRSMRFQSHNFIFSFSQPVLHVHVSSPKFFHTCVHDKLRSRRSM